MGDHQSELSALRAQGERRECLLSGSTPADRPQPGEELWTSDERGQIHVIPSLHRSARALGAQIMDRGCTRAKNTSDWPLVMLSNETAARSCCASVVRLRICGRRSGTRSHSSTRFLLSICGCSLSIVLSKPRNSLAISRFGTNACSVLIVHSSEVHQGGTARSRISSPGWSAKTHRHQHNDWQHACICPDQGAEPDAAADGMIDFNVTLISNVVRTLAILNNLVNFCRPEAATLKRLVEADPRSTPRFVLVLELETARPVPRLESVYRFDFNVVWPSGSR